MRDGFSDLIWDEETQCHDPMLPYYREIRSTECSKHFSKIPSMLFTFDFPRASTSPHCACAWLHFRAKTTPTQRITAMRIAANNLPEYYYKRI